jgi:hypothetical protein
LLEIPPVSAMKMALKTIRNPHSESPIEIQKKNTFKVVAP